MAYPVTTGDLISAADWNSIGMFPIDDRTLSSDTTGVAITSINQNFAHLLLKISARSDASATSDTVRIRFNSDSGTNYLTQQLSASGSTVAATRTTGAAFIDLGEIAAANSSPSHVGLIEASIIDYRNTDWYKRVSTQNNYRLGTSGPALQIQGGEWISTNAITRIDLTPVSGSNFVANSRFTLYGMTV